MKRTTPSSSVVLPSPHITKKPAPFQVRVSLCTAWQRPSAPSLTPSHSRRGRHLYLPLNHDTSSLTYFEIRYRHSPPGRVRCLPYPYITKKPAPFQVRVSLCTAWQRPTLPGPFGPSTIGAGGLNGRVRDGNAWIPSAIITRRTCHSLRGIAPSKLNTSSKR